VVEMEKVTNQYMHKLVLPCVLAGCLLVIWIGTTAVSAPSTWGAIKATETAKDSAVVPPAIPSQPSGKCTIGTRYPQSIQRWCPLIITSAGQSGLPAALIAAVMLQESGGDPAAYSASGAVGLLQVMPRDGMAANFNCAAGPCFASRPTITELLAPGYNLNYGARLLASLVARAGGDQRMALKAYGPMDVGFTYADKVLAIYERYQ
jgi:soluble lytic murein transglycosylase-like protein